MNLSNSKSRFLFTAIVILAGFLTIGAVAQASVQELPSFELPQIPAGTVEGTGMRFSIFDSSYLNITLDSTETIKLRMESIPEMVTMMMESVSDISSTQIILSGFQPNTTYYLYQDDYHNLTEFTADNSGTYSYSQDLTTPHLIFIQPRKSTKFIKDDATGGDCAKTPNPIGTWNAATKTCVLSMDLTETIQIDSNNITLDGNGRTITGSNTGNGVYLSGRTGVTIKNLNVKQFTYGIRSESSQDVAIEGNTISSNSYGITISHGNNHTLNNNTVSDNQYGGIGIGFSGGNILRNNVVVRNGQFSQYNLHGVQISNSNSNTLSGNVISNNGYGLQLFSVENITMTANRIFDNTYNFLLFGTQDSHFSGNIIDDTNTVDSKPIYYVKNAIGDVYDDSANIGTFYCINCRNVTIKNLTLSKNRTGIFFWNTTGSRVENINVAANEYGIWFQSSHSNMVTGNYGWLGLWQSRTNTIKNHSGEIDLRDASNGNNVLDNNARGTIHAIYIEASHNNIIMGNTAVASQGAGIELYIANNNILRENKSGYGYYGIYLHGSYNNLLEDNTIDQYRLYGILLAFSKYNIIEGNTISNHAGQYGGRGLYLSNAAQYNKIYNNNFVKNPVPVFFGSNSTNNVFHLDLPIGGNYWDSFNEPSEGCYDNNADGLCDAPYIFTGGQDNLPWTKKDGWLVPLNQPPVLSFPTTGPYAGDGIDPNTGTANSTPFFFKIIYTDADNNPPSNKTLVVDNGVTAISYIMTLDTEAPDTLHDGNYTNGEQYTFTSQFPRGDYRYHFEAADGTNAARIPANDISFLSGLIVAVKSSANIRSDRGTSASIIGAAQRGDLLELFPLCSEMSGTNCNDDALLYTLKDGHYWLKIKWNNSTGFIAEDLVMTVVPENQPERVKKIMTEVFALPDFDKIRSFPLELILAIAAHESGGTLNNEITSVDSPFSGIMQVHPKTSGWNSNCVNLPPFRCQLNDGYWTNIKNPFTDIFDISTNNKDGKVFMLKNYVSTSYSNTDDGLKNNIFDGLKVLIDKYRARCPKESIFFTDSLTGTVYELKCGDMEKIRATWAYNGFGGGYLAMVSDSLHNLSNVFPATSYQNTDQLIEKLFIANNHKIEVKKYSPVDLRVQDSSGAIVGEFNGEVKDEIYNAIYDPSTESIGIFFPQDTYRYVVVGNATSTYGLVINSTDDATTTTFIATDIPVIPGVIHEYAIDKEALERGEDGVTIQIDENGDGVFEKTIVSDGELTQEEYILQTKTVIDFDPDTLNIKSGSGRATVYIELPDGFDVGAIDTATVKLNGIATLEKPTSISDYDNDGIPNLMAKFDRSTIIKTLPQEGDSATIAITGKVLHNGNRLSFKGEDTIKIVGRK